MLMSETVILGILQADAGTAVVAQSGLCPLHRSPHRAAKQDRTGAAEVDRRAGEAKLLKVLGVEMVIFAYFIIFQP